MSGFSIQNALSLIIVAAFIGALGYWMIHPPTEFSPVAGTVINVLLGALVAKFTSVVDFHFGSSKGSLAKDQTISDMAAAGKPNGIPVPVAQPPQSP